MAITGPSMVPRLYQLRQSKLYVQGTSGYADCTPHWLRRRPRSCEYLLFASFPSICRYMWRLLEYRESVTRSPAVNWVPRSLEACQLKRNHGKTEKKRERLTEAVWRFWNGHAHVCLWGVIFPLLRHVDSVTAHKWEWRLEWSVKASRADNNVISQLNTASRENSSLGNLWDIVVDNSFQEPRCRCLATASNWEGGH